MVAVNSEGEVPLDIAEEDDMRSFLEKEVTKQGRCCVIYGTLCSKCQ